MKTRLALLVGATALSAACILNCGDDDIAEPVTAPSDSGTDGATTDAAPVDDGGIVDAGTDAATSLPKVWVDRVGRAGAIFMTIDPGSRNDWNAEDGFYPTEGLYEDQVQNNLVAMDMLDSVNDFDASTIPPGATPPDGGTLHTHPLHDFGFRDFLVVDSSKPFSPTSYLDIENEFYLAGAAHATCGGRWPGEDALDKQLSVVIKGQMTGVSDGVSAATKPPTMTFPYLADPN